MWSLWVKSQTSDAGWEGRLIWKSPTEINASVSTVQYCLSIIVSTHLHRCLNWTQQTTTLTNLRNRKVEGCVRDNNHTSFSLEPHWRKWIMGWMERSLSEVKAQDLLTKLYQVQAHLSRCPTKPWSTEQHTNRQSAQYSWGDDSSPNWKLPLTRYWTQENDLFHLNKNSILNERTNEGACFSQLPDISDKKI